MPKELTYHQAYYLANKAKYNAQSERWREGNRARYNELQRRWREEHPEAVKVHIQKGKLWKKANPDKVKAAKKRNFLKYREHFRVSAKAYNKIKRQNPVFIAREKVCAKAWAKANPEKIAAKAKRWRLKNKPKLRLYAIHGTHKRRALLRGNCVNPKSILIFTRGVKALPLAVCYYCQKSISSMEVTFDHIIPLSKGGAHSVENLCVACKKCNFKKHNSMIEDWKIVGQQILSL